MKEPYQLYVPLPDINESVLPLFNDKGERSGASNFEPAVAENSAREIVDQFAADDPEIKEIVKKSPKSADQIPEMKKWLQSRLAAAK